MISDVSERCLVLGGGGVAGIAWMTGLLRGLQVAYLRRRTPRPIAS